MALTRSQCKRKRQHAQRPPEATATVTLPVDILHVVNALQLARNQGRDEVLVMVKTWRVQIDDQP